MRSEHPHTLASSFTLNINLKFKTFGLNVDLFRLSMAVLLLCASCFDASPSFAQAKLNAPAKNKNIKALSWLAGKWKTKNANPSFEEHWMSPQGGAMIGMGRSMDGAKLDFHEYLRIEQRQNGLIYVAQPMGRKETEFRLARENKNTLVFENPEHDFPQVIEYKKREDGSLSVRVSGLGKKKDKAFQHILFKY